MSYITRQQKLLIVLFPAFQELRDDDLYSRMKKDHLEFRFVLI